MPAAGEDPRLLHLCDIRLGLPEARRTIIGRHADYRVRKRVFGYCLDVTITVIAEFC